MQDGTAFASGRLLIGVRPARGSRANGLYLEAPRRRARREQEQASLKTNRVSVSLIGLAQAAKRLEKDDCELLEVEAGSYVCYCSTVFRKTDDEHWVINQ